MKQVESYRDLAVWRKAIDLTVHCYEASSTFPKSEIFGLAGQMRRAAVSIGANIAEGRGRRYTGDFIRFISNAYGSLAELETHVIVAKRLSYIDDGEANELLYCAGEIGRMLNGFLKTLKRKGQKDAPSYDG